MPQVETGAIIPSIERSEHERVERMTAEESRKQKEEEQRKEHERRLTQGAEELARFHRMKKMRSASEAAKASLEEF